jgi:hypothetical protein
MTRPGGKQHLPVVWDANQVQRAMNNQYTDFNNAEQYLHIR